MATNVVLIGPPGTGKDTRLSQAKEMIPELISISTGNLLRKKGVDTSTGKLISDDIIMELLKEEISSVKYRHIVVLNGVPRNVEQAEMMNKCGIRVDRVIYLPITEDEAIKRTIDRVVCSNPECQEIYTEKSDFKSPKVKGICDKCKSSLVKRLDDNSATVAERIRVYTEQTKPVISWYEEHQIPIIEIGSNEHICYFFNAITG